MASILTQRTPANRDFKRWYDSASGRNYETFGYMTYYLGEAADMIVSAAWELAQAFAAEHNVPVESVRVGQITQSARFKYFWWVYSVHPAQAPHPEAQQMEGVEKWLWSLT